MARLFTPVPGRQRVDRYELVGALASGGMATVFLARLSGVGGFQRFVAVKRLHPHLAGDAKIVEMFLDEGRIAARIHHPNVVPILEVGTGADGYYLVMVYIEGDTLGQLMHRAAQRGQRLPIPITLRIALDVLAGLHAAHELCDDSSHPIHLVHRDVSPQNVLVGVDGIARITDFGVARATSRANETLGGELKGKIAYMAPEQAAGEASLDRRADVYAAGIVIWEALAGKRLFKAKNEAETLLRVMTEATPPLTEVTPDLGIELSNAVMHALEREPSQRFATCAEFADALERATAGKQGIATPRELAAFVATLLGSEVSAQREAVRAWIARSDSNQLESPSSATPASSVSAAAPLTQSNIEEQTPNDGGVQPALPGRRTALNRKLALLLVVAVGGGLLLHRARQNRSGASAATRSAMTGVPEPSSPPAITSVPELSSPPAITSVPEPSSPPAPVSAATPAASLASSPALPPPAAAAPVTRARPRAAPKKSGTKTEKGVDLRNPYR